MFAAVVASGEIIDRTVAVVGSEIITASDLMAQLKLEAMFNGRAVENSEAARNQSLERLIAQRLIEADMRLAGYATTSEEELKAAFDQLRQGRFGDMPFEEALQSYEVGEEVALQFFRRQVNFAGYVAFRFRTGLEVSAEEIAAEYRARRPEAEGEVPEPISLEIREILLDRKADRLLDSRLKQLRAETRIVFLEPIETPTPEGAP